MLKLIIDFGTMLIGTEGVILLLRKASQRETPQAHSPEEAPGPPAESEHLTFQSTGKFIRAFESINNGIYIGSKIVRKGRRR